MASASDHTFDTALRAFDDPDAYPDGAAIIAADHPEMLELVAQAASEHRPIVVVFDDGTELIAEPPKHRVGNIVRRILSAESPESLAGGVRLPASYGSGVRRARQAA